MEIRDAAKEDASALAYLINLAGEGIPMKNREHLPCDEYTARLACYTATNG